MKRIKFSKDASRELEEAAAWYEKEQPGLGRRLIASVENAIEHLSEPNPPFTPVIGSAGKMGAKKLLLHKFPSKDRGEPEIEAFLTYLAVNRGVG